MKMVDNEQEHRVSSLKDWEVTWYHGDFGYRNYKLQIVNLLNYIKRRIVKF